MLYSVMESFTKMFALLFRFSHLTDKIQTTKKETFGGECKIDSKTINLSSSVLERT